MSRTLIKPLKISTLKIKRLRFTRAGDRTLTSSKKEKLKAEKNYKCQRCGLEKLSRHLEIHHTDEISKVKRRAGFMGALPKPTFDRKTPYHDRKDKVMVLCKDCHTDIHDEARKKPKKRNKIRSPLDF